jgi:hypothetical protein
MRKRIGLACAMVLMSFGVSSSASPIRVAEVRLGTTTAAFCPVLPPDCCRWRLSGGCRICEESGC